MGGRGATSKMEANFSSPQSSKVSSVYNEKNTRSIRFNALKWAKEKIGSEEYARLKQKGIVAAGLLKCNQFVYHAFNKSNNQKIIEGPPSKKWGGLLGDRYPSVNEFYFGTVPGFTRVTKPKLGDICVDVYNGGKLRSNHGHIGVVSDIKGKTISASSKTNRIVENDWGFRKENSRARFYRYVGKSSNQR